MDTANKELYDCHVKSWETFFESTSEYLTALKANVDQNGFSTSVLDIFPANSMHQTTTLLSGEKMANVTCLTGGCGYPVLGINQKNLHSSTGVAMLPTACEVSVFFASLALLFAETRAQGRQYIAPLQLNLTMTSHEESYKLASQWIFPHVDLDDEILVPHDVLEKALIDDDGYVRESELKKLHFTPEQLAHRAKIAAGVLARILCIDPAALFVAIMRSPVPGITFVRTLDEKNKKFGFRFSPKCDGTASMAQKQPLVKLKPSYWLVFGLKKLLELPVQTFKDPTTDKPLNPGEKGYYDGLRRSSLYVNCARMMRKDESLVVDNDIKTKNFLRGYGIVMHPKALSAFRMALMTALQDDCRRSGSDSWRLPHNIKLTPDCIQVDHGVTGMRPVRASKKFPCAYHQLYHPVQTFRQDPVLTPPDTCPCMKLPLKQKRLCTIPGLSGEVSMSSADQTKQSRCPFPTGVHVDHKKGIDSKDKWLLTSRCNEVVLIVDGNGNEVPWAMELLRHVEYGPIFEASLTNLFVPATVGRVDEPDECPAPGMVVKHDNHVHRYPIFNPGEDIEVEVVEPTVVRNEVLTYERFIPGDMPLWEPDPSKADFATRAHQRITASEPVEKVTTNHILLECLEERLRAQMLCHDSFKRMNFKTGVRVQGIPETERIRIFVTKPTDVNMGIVVCCGPPFYCENHRKAWFDAVVQYYGSEDFHPARNEYSIKSFFHDPVCEEELNEVVGASRANEEKPATGSKKKAKRSKRSNVVHANNLVVRYVKSQDIFLSNFSCSNALCRKHCKERGPASIVKIDSSLRAILGMPLKTAPKFTPPWELTPAPSNSDKELMDETT